MVLTTVDLGLFKFLQCLGVHFKISSLYMQSIKKIFLVANSVF